MGADVKSKVTDAHGHALSEYDDVAMLKPTIFSKNEAPAAGSITTNVHLVREGGEATIIGVYAERDGEADFVYLDLESCDGAFFHFALPEAVKFVRSADSKRLAQSCGDGSKNV